MKILGNALLLSLISLSAVAFTELTAVNLLDSQPAKIDLHRAGSKGTVIVFLSANCPCSDSHMVELLRLKDKYPEFQFVGIHSNANESLELAKKYFSEKKVSFPVLQDEKAAIADQYKAYKTPHVFVLSAGGEKLYQGGVSDSSNLSKAKNFYLADALEAIKQSKPMAVTESRTLGCVIMRETELKKNVW